MPKDIKEMDIDDENIKYSILGFKIFSEYIFALGLYYNSKYVKNEEFYIKYIKFVNETAVEFNKIVKITSDINIPNDYIIEMINDVKKLRHKDLL